MRKGSTLANWVLLGDVNVSVSEMLFVIPTLPRIFNASIGRASIPVSYTHLDVYKRQTLLQMPYRPLLPIVFLKRSLPLMSILSRTGNLCCFKLFRTHVNINMSVDKVLALAQTIVTIQIELPLNKQILSPKPCLWKDTNVSHPCLQMIFGWHVDEVRKKRNDYFILKKKGMYLSFDTSPF